MASVFELAAMDPDFHSSDVEYEPAVSKRKEFEFAGKASIDRMVEDAPKDRVTSKRTVKQLEFGRGAIGTRYQQALWVNRFEHFRKDTLKQSLDVPFTCDDMLRFLDSILGPGKLKLSTGKPAPNDDLAINASKILLSYGTFRWSVKEGFEFTAQHRAHFQTFISDAVQEGRLLRGHWRKKTWIGFVTLSRMVRAYLSHALANGTLNWDLVIARCLSVVLVSALGCRGGDVARSKGYTGTEYMQYRHVELYLVDIDEHNGTGTMANVRATITIQYAKGEKDKIDESLVKHLRPLLDQACHHVCPINLLLVHTLRHRMVEGGTTLQQVLDHAAKRGDRRIVWTHPNRPILSGIARKPWSCDLDRPAGVKQLLSTMAELGLISGILTRSYTHALRLGAARDTSHLPASLSDETASRGVTFDEVGRSMGHKGSTIAANITHQYIGDSSVDFYSARAAAQIVHVREPDFAQQPSEMLDAIRRPVTAQEREVAEKNYSFEYKDSPGKTGSLTRLVRRNRLNALKDTTPKAPRQSTKMPNLEKGPPPLPPASGPLSNLSVNLPRLGPKSGKGKARVERSMANNDEARTEIAPTDIDPTLLDENDISALQVPQADLDALQTILLQSTNADDDSVEDSTQRTSSDTINAMQEDEDDEAVRLLLNDDDGDCTTIPPSLGPERHFVNEYARYNVVSNENFAKQWRDHHSDADKTFDSTMGLHSVRGNARDDPTPFLHSCSVVPDCTFQSIFLWNVKQHEERCGPPKWPKSNNELTEEGSQRSQAANKLLDIENGAEDDPRRCQHTGCDYVVLSDVNAKEVARRMKTHVRSVHSWTPKACEHGCTPENLFNTAAAYKSHQFQHHGSTWPVKCSYPGCEDPQEFTRLRNLVHHLTKAHQLLDDQARLPYCPQSTGQQMVFTEQSCTISGCTSSLTFSSPSGLVRHLMTKAHSMAKEEAEAWVKENAVHVAKAERAVTASQARKELRGVKPRKAKRAKIEHRSMGKIEHPSMGGETEGGQ